MTGLFGIQPPRPAYFTETVNGHLTKVGNAAVLTAAEKESIRRSLNYMRSQLTQYFGDSINEQLTFGSFSRGTILPRWMDTYSDVDHMIVFENDGSQPQTDLNRLRRFVELKYQRSAIKQSHPTIQLELNHICFELVPAIDAFFYGYNIPAPASDFMDWMDTNPTGFNSDLTSANTTHNSLIKPLVRIMKYWNAQAGYPFASFELEKNIVGNVSYYNSDLKAHFYEQVDNLSTWWGLPQWKRERIQRLKDKVSTIKELERQYNSVEAVARIKQILPLSN